jgi:methyl-accepting chemotaxis protein
MQVHRLPFRQRIVGKMLLFGVVPTVLALVVLIGLNMLRGARAFEERAYQEIAEATRLAAATVDARNEKMAVLVRGVARAQIEGGLFGRREPTITYLRAVVGSDRDIQAAYVVYEPNADGGDAASIGTVDPRALDSTGRFVPYLRRDASQPDGVRLEPTVGMEDPNYLYYLEPKRLAEREGVSSVVFTKPYVYEGVAMIEQTYPLVVDGRFVGIAGIDQTLESIDEAIRAIGDRLGGDIFLATRGLFVAASTDAHAAEGEQLKTTPVADGPFQRLMLTHVVGPGDVRVLRDVDPVLGVDCFYGVTELENGGWTILLRKPTTEMVGALWSMLFMNTMNAIIAVAVVSFLLLALARGIGRRLDVAVAAASRVAEGDLAQPIPEGGSQDESGVLLESFRAMADNLNRIVGQVRQASIQINSTSTELAATSRQQEETVSGFGASTTQIAAATRQISATGAELLRTMQTISQSAAGAGEKAQASREGLESMQASMSRLEHAAQSVAARLSAIDDKAQGINAIVATITKVADQTNLLSVNAAIEAEKAGEFGVGFLVVAREIRRLADQTAAATLDIERMIRQMQTAVSSGVLEMDRFGESLGTVKDDASRVNDSLQGIIHHVEDDTQRFAQVTEGMRSQAAGAKQIDDAMRGLSAGARHTLETSKEFARAAGDLQAAIASLKATVSAIKLRERTE